MKRQSIQRRRSNACLIFEICDVVPVIRESEAMRNLAGVVLLERDCLECLYPAVLEDEFDDFLLEVVQKVNAERDVL